MTIQYSDGKAVEAVVMSRTETTLRAVIEGADDVTEFSNIHGIWVSEDCEPVTIVFAWQRRNSPKAMCSQELAARLVLSVARPYGLRSS